MEGQMRQYNTNDVLEEGRLYVGTPIATLSYLR